jgi:hypothetical protein
LTFETLEQTGAAEREALQASIDGLAAERDGLQLMVERDGGHAGWRSVMAELTAERDRLRASTAVFAAERDASQKEADELAAALEAQRGAREAAELKLQSFAAHITGSGHAETTHLEAESVRRDELVAARAEGAAQASEEVRQQLQGVHEQELAAARAEVADLQLVAARAAEAPGSGEAGLQLQARHEKELMMARAEVEDLQQSLLAAQAEAASAAGGGGVSAKLQPAHEQALAEARAETQQRLELVYARHLQAQQQEHHAQRDAYAGELNSLRAQVRGVRGPRSHFYCIARMEDGADTRGCRSCWRLRWTSRALTRRSSGGSPAAPRTAPTWRRRCTTRSWRRHSAERWKCGGPSRPSSQPRRKQSKRPQLPPRPAGQQPPSRPTALRR